jgi:hypothetical protein
MKRFTENQIFGHLKLIKRIDSLGRWECECICGKLVIRNAHSISTGKHVSSCGCKRHELSRNAGKNSKTWTGYGDISGQFFASIKASAKLRKIPLNITIQDAWEQFLKQDRKCIYSGVELVFRQSVKLKDVEQTASLDRIDSSKPYEIGNIQWVHKIVNKMKYSFTEDYFLDLCNKVAEHNEWSECIRTH